jgi:hypothetical protein
MTKPKHSKRHAKKPIKHHVIAEVYPENVPSIEDDISLPSVPAKTIAELNAQDSREPVVIVAVPKSAWQKFLDLFN